MYKVFINDRKIILTNKIKEYQKDNTVIFYIKSEKDFKQKIYSFLSGIYKQKNTLYVINNDPDKMWAYLNNYTVSIEAAGGLVINPPGDLLFIYRYLKWDLPKGKREPDENPETTAKREVMEECGVGDLKIIKPLPSTFHMYQLSSDKWALKKTIWYLMRSDDWKNPKPQYNEDIRQAIWVHPENVNYYLKNTYPSIIFLIENHLNL